MVERGWPEDHPYEVLLCLEGAGNQIRLITNATELVAQTGETQRIDGAVIDLEIIRSAQHWFSGADKLVRHRYAIDPAVEWFLFPLDKAGQKPELEILVASCDFGWSCARIDDLFTNCQVSVQPVTEYKLRVFVSSVGLEN